MAHNDCCNVYITSLSPQFGGHNLMDKGTMREAKMRNYTKKPQNVAHPTLTMVHDRRPADETTNFKMLSTQKLIIRAALAVADIKLLDKCRHNAFSNEFDLSSNQIQYEVKTTCKESLFIIYSTQGKIVDIL